MIVMVTMAAVVGYGDGGDGDNCDVDDSDRMFGDGEDGGSW